MAARERFASPGSVDVALQFGGTESLEAVFICGCAAPHIGL